MKIKIAIVFYMTALALCVQLQAVGVQAQRTERDVKTAATKKPKVVELKAARATLKRDEPDANIKIDDAPNVQTERARRPAAKGGAQARRGGGDCKVVFGNDTDLRVKLYIDGIFRGTAAAFGDAYLYLAPTAKTVVYARADFADGTYRFWGPETYECGSNQFIYFKLSGEK